MRNGELFEQELERLTRELEEQFAESAWLEAEIRSRLTTIRR